MGDYGLMGECDPLSVTVVVAIMSCTAILDTPILI